MGIGYAEFFKLRQLPVKYLGMSLASDRLSDHDCKPLIEKITCKIDGWAVKKLSYSGRLQLIQSVIHFLVNF